MLDVSDGLAGDARHLAAASGVRLTIELERLPVAPAAAAEAERLKLAPALFAGQGGEDYELLVALPAGFGVEEAQAFHAATGVALTRIGVVESGSGVRLLLRRRRGLARGLRSLPVIYGLRSFAWLFCLTVWHALKVTVAALAGVRDRPGGFYDRELRTWARRLLEVTGLPVEVRGLDRLPPAACVYAANHASFVDIWVMVARLPGSVRFVAKRELYRYPDLRLGAPGHRADPDGPAEPGSRGALVPVGGRRGARRAVGDRVRGRDAEPGRASQ